MRDIGTLGGKHSFATAIKNGKVIGSALNGAGQVRAFIWTQAGQISDLGTLGGKSATPVAINLNGDVVGTAQAANGAWKAVLWSSGAVVDLNTKLQNAPAGLVLTAALAVSDNGTVVAVSNQGLVMLRPQP
ncbi:hypothetical protein LMG26411_04695 [Cupriavidus numazuensis]|uniref:Uncharacterized protein n=2 Tax=Cupriavidus numazuensis TaxID=221992 RepID=A0ABM8TM79_9BURK|nr:hypothetical protein LMG26411_04695 [Cupriavidus numazuensis]